MTIVDDDEDPEVRSKDAQRRYRQRRKAGFELLGETIAELPQRYRSKDSKNKMHISNPDKATQAVYAIRYATP